MNRAILTQSVRENASGVKHLQRWMLQALLLLALAAPLGSHASQPLRVVGTGGRIAVGAFTVSGSATAFWQRTAHKLGGPVDEIDVGFMNWVHSTTAEVANLYAITINYAWIERASTGQVVPLTFSGQRQLVMPASDSAAYHLADTVPSSAWTGSAPARDEVFWVHAKGSIPSGGTIYQGTLATFSGAKFIIYDPANDPGTKDFAGTVPTITGQNVRTSGLPMLFLGRYSGPGYLSVIGIGDSILDGLGDTVNPTPVITGNGFFNRAALDANGANTIAMMNLTRSGETAVTWVNNHARQAQMLSFGNVVVEEFGTNDIGSNGASANVTTIFGRLNSIWATVRAAGVQKIVRTRLLPRTTSTSTNWTSLADQTPNPGWGAGEARDQLNADLSTALTSGSIDALVDTLAPVSDPTDNHYWFSNGTSDYMTSDGTHPKPAGYALLAPPLRAALLALSVDDYSAWSGKFTWGTASSAPAADPNNDGVKNLMAYALNIPPLIVVAPGDLPQSANDTTTPNGPWLAFTYRVNSRAADLIYTVQTCTDLAIWTNVLIDGVNAVSEIANPDPDSDGIAVLMRVRLKLAGGEPRRFLRLRISASTL